MMPFIARWDLDKTYLRTNFDTVRDLLRTAVQRPDQKQTVPGAASLMRELHRHGAYVHILSGSPEQLRSRIEQKLRLDGVAWHSLTLKPNLQNILRLRFRAVRGQIGYKLPVLLLRRSELEPQANAEGELTPEILLGDDAEADAFIYSLYADVCSGRVSEDLLREVMLCGGAYEDTIDDAVRFLHYVSIGNIVNRILIHLERQSSPDSFSMFGSRVVPFYNYFQAAFVLYAEGRLPASSVLRVAHDLIVFYNFDNYSLVRSFEELQTRVVLSPSKIATLPMECQSYRMHSHGVGELRAVMANIARSAKPSLNEIEPVMKEIDYLKWVNHFRKR